MNEFVQVVDADGKFDDEIFSKTLKTSGLLLNGLNYHILSVLGPQSSGKSTLLNTLFSTTFPTMNSDQGRYQVTQGICAAKAKSDDIIIFDLEGNDSKERSTTEDNFSFERKISLFALSISEILVVNMWYQDIGRYNASNLSLLKNIFELDLQLFAKHKSAKTLLVFLIRDYPSQATPFQMLKKQISGDVDKIWRSLTKPEEFLKSEATDFFDIEFETLPHYVLQRQEFDQEIEHLRKRFTDSSSKDYLFKSSYSKAVPIDGLPMYGSNIWKTIMENRDLDIPSQREMLALFRCGEIGADLLKSFEEYISKCQKDVDEKLAISKFGEESSRRIRDIFQQYNLQTQYYSRKVMELKAKEMEDKMRKDMKNIFLQLLGNFMNNAKKSFEQLMLSITGNGQNILQNFEQVVSERKQTVIAWFDEHAQESMLPLEKWDYSSPRSLLLSDIDAFIQEVRKVQILRITEKQMKSLEEKLSDPIARIFSNPTKALWAALRSLRASSIDACYQNIPEKFEYYGMKISEAEVVEQREKLTEKIDNVLDRKILDYTSILSLKMHKIFDESFRYGPGNIPRIWTDTRSIDDAFIKARSDALLLLDLLFLNRLRETELDEVHLRLPIPLSSGSNSQTTDGSNSFEYPLSTEAFDANKKSCILLDAENCRRIYDEFVISIASAYSDAQHQQLLNTQRVSIPWWIYILLLALGWNELMTVLSSPMYLIIVLALFFLFGLKYLQRFALDYLKDNCSQATLLMIKSFLANVPFQILDLDEIIIVNLNPVESNTSKSSSKSSAEDGEVNNGGRISIKHQLLNPKGSNKQKLPGSIIVE